MIKFTECISFEFNKGSYEEERWNYTSQIKKIIENKYEILRGKDVVDVCSTLFYKDEQGNWVFRYKVVPGTAQTSASYSFRYALIVSPSNIINIQQD